MLINYLIDILIFDGNVIVSYNKLLYAIINTLYKITTASSVDFAKRTILKFKVFLSNEYFVRRGHSFVSQIQYRKICEWCLSIE